MANIKINSGGGIIRKLDIDSNSGNHWHLLSTTALNINNHHANLSPLCIRTGLAKTCLNASWLGGKAWQAHLQATKLNLKIIQHLFPAGLTITNTVNATFNATSNASGHIVAEAKMHLSKGVMRYPLFSQTQIIPIEQGDLNASINNNGLNLKTHIKFDAGETLTGSLNLPGYHGQGLPAPRQAVRGNVNLKVTHLRLLPLLIPQLSNAEGQMALNVNITGNLYQPVLYGNLNLKNASAQIPEANLSLKNIDVHLSALDNGQMIIDASLSSGKGNLTITGNGIVNAKKIQTQITIKGENVLVSNLEEAKIIASPDLVLKTDNNKITLSGSINIPSANIKPKDFQTSVVSANDIILYRDNKLVTKKSPYQLHSKIKVSLGDDVKLEYIGINAKLIGTITIFDSPNSLTTAVGVLKTTEGGYTAYGQDLKIDHGKLIFTGGPINQSGA